MPNAHDAPSFSDAGIREWNGHVEAVLRGLAHALNNRAAALSAVLELSADPQEDGSTKSILDTELLRVRELADVIRMIGPARGGAEAFSPDEAGHLASAVLKLHADLGGQPAIIRAEQAPPVRLPRWMFVRALIALGATARTALPKNTPLTIDMTPNGDWLEVIVPGDAAATSGYVAELARAMDGDVIDGRAGFRVPTLVAIRQREGR
jgi:hypothetical protein